MPVKRGCWSNSNPYPRQEDCSKTPRCRSPHRAAHTLVPPLGTDAFVKEFVSMKVKKWCDQLLNLANIATIQPHVVYITFTRRFVHKLTFLARTTPNIDSLLQPIEEIIQSWFIPAWTSMAPPNAMMRELFALPAWVGSEYLTLSPTLPKIILTPSSFLLLSPS